MENCLHQIKSIFLKSGKSKIAIIGKGDSIQNIDLKRLDDFFIITINDADKLVDSDIDIFYRTDLFEKVRNNGFRSNYYLAPAFFKIPDAKHIEVEHRSAGPDSFEIIYEYLKSDQFFLTDFVILSAIKLVIFLQTTLDKKIETFFLGFDFYADAVSSDDYEMYDLAYKVAILKTQESFFKNVLENFEEWFPDVSLTHVGEKLYSGSTINLFNQSLVKKEKQGVERLLSNKALYTSLIKKVRETERVIVVAEFTNNHIGNTERLIKMVELAKESGADMIKLQKRDVASFYTPEELKRAYKSPFGLTLGEYRNGVELSREQFLLLDAKCREIEIPWFVSVLDWNSYIFMKEFDPPLLKLPSTISNHKNYLLRVAKDFEADLVISTGFTDQDYESFILQNFSDERTLFLLQCTSSYPTPPEACQISVIRHYGEISSGGHKNLLPGYSSHDMGSLGCMLAVAAGAKMVEKHVKLGDLDWVHFDAVAIDLYNNHFKEFVHDIRKVELMCGTKYKLVHEQEHHKYIPNSANN
jgi:sialic acid synthase SpsE